MKFRSNKIIRSSVDPARVKHALERLREAGGTAFLDTASEEQLRILCAVLAGSTALVDQLVQRPEWLKVIEPEALNHPRRAQGVRQEVSGWLNTLIETKDYESALRLLREFKQYEMLRIAARDLARLGSVEVLTREISNVAEVCLDAVWRICRRQLEDRLGPPCHKAGDGQWQVTKACVLGMGKLGGQELNYSSDVDVLFVYDEEGSVFREPPTSSKTPRGVMTNHEFFNRLGEAFINEVSRNTEEGFLFRIDLRLRPEGNSGPLARSLVSYENYYAQWGQTWERMMLIKARRVAGDEAVAGEFLEMVQPFRFPRALSEGALQEVAAVKERIENEVVRSDELDRNVKLGRGGIREIEFIVQSLQLLHAGKQPFLQTAQTLPCLDKLAQYNLIPGDEAAQLSEAYCFLRDVEHRLQMEANLQTHTIPESKPTRERLARLMGFKTLAAFEKALKAHLTRVRESFERTLRKDQAGSEDALPIDFEGYEAQWKEVLEAHWFRDVTKAFRMLREFVEGPGYIHISTRTVLLARRLLPRLFNLCRRKGERIKGDLLARPVLSDPDRVMTRMDSFISAYGARSTLFELWARHPQVFELLLLLFDRSEFLAELAIRTPDLVDDLVVSGRLRQRKTAEDTLRDLMHGLGDADQHAWVRRYQQTEQIRIGLRDILDLAEPRQMLAELTALAEACLCYAVAVIQKKHRLKRPPFAVLGLGKLGGSEITYGSDLDILFVAPTRTRNLPKLQKLAKEVMDLLSSRTELGVAFVTDARLRPDGEKGLLVNTLDAYEEYYRHRAQLWEVQCISRVRMVGGDVKTGNAFTQLASDLTDFREPNLPLEAYTKDWKRVIHEMRMRIEKERTPAGQDALAIKTGRGGLMDAEFIAQALCLEHGWHEPNTLKALEHGAAEGKLATSGKLVESYAWLRRVEGILRRWSYEGETVLPDDPAPFYRVGVRCGYVTSEAFRAAVARHRKTIREAYARFFGV